MSRCVLCSLLSPWQTHPPSLEWVSQGKEIKRNPPNEAKAEIKNPTKILSFSPPNFDQSYVLIHKLKCLPSMSKMKWGGKCLFSFINFTTKVKLINVVGPSYIQNHKEKNCKCTWQEVGKEFAVLEQIDSMKYIYRFLSIIEVEHGSSSHLHIKVHIHSRLVVK